MRGQTQQAFLLLAAVLTCCECIQPKSLSDAIPSNPSLDCLEARERDPTVKCNDLAPLNGRNVRVVYNLTQVDKERTVQEQKVAVKFALNRTANVEGISLYNYPTYQDHRCGSDGEYFCDPYGYLSPAERQNISAEMVKLRGQHLVMCEDLVLEPINQRHLMPFYVGVAIAEAGSGESSVSQEERQRLERERLQKSQGLPIRGADVELKTRVAEVAQEAEVSSSSLKQYGQLILSEWTTRPNNFWATPPSMARCPQSALLLVMPRNGQAVLVTESCRYLCEDSKAGQLVARQLRSATVHGAVLAGLQQAYADLPVSVKQGEDMPSAVATPQPQQVESPESWIVFVQRAIFAFAVMALGLSFAVGFLVMCFAEGIAKGHRGYL